RDSFTEFDDRLLAQQALKELGVVLVHTPADLHPSLLAHTTRRLRAGGWAPIVAVPSAGASIFRELGRQLGLDTLPAAPSSCAEALASVAMQRRSVLLAVMPEEGSWDHAVASAFPHVGKGAVLVLFSSREPSAWDERVFRIEAELAPSEKARWLNAIAE